MPKLALTVSLLLVLGCRPSGQNALKAGSIGSQPGNTAATTINRQAHSGVGKIHFEMSGMIPVQHDVKIDRCVLWPADSRIPGLDIRGQRDEVLEDFLLLHSRYTSDGSYSYSGDELTKHPYLVLALARNKALPDGAVIDSLPNSELTVTVQDGGTRGTATFDNWRIRTLLNSGSASGRFAWECTEVRHLKTGL